MNCRLFPYVSNGRGLQPGAIKSLHATFKKVRTTETQRLIKKLRFLRTKEGTKDECADLEAQLELIKASSSSIRALSQH